MLEMEYDTDTLTAANKNRAASKKLFQQLQQSARAAVLAASPVLDLQPAMLHRTPSGAQKKIRQRQEQRWLKAASSSGLDHQQPASSECGYRSLIDSGAYKSILPDEPPFSLSPTVPPRVPPRGSAPLSSSLTSLNSTGSSSTSASSIPAPSACIIGGKPTVEVHPMPSQPQKGTESPGLNLTPSPDFVNEKTREKPAVPKKPAKLLLSSVRMDSPATSPAPLSLSTSSLNIPPSPSQPSPSIGRLFSTPSLMCLHTALMQPSLSDEDIERLESKRQKLIESISRKVAVLDEERIGIEEEIEANEMLRRVVADDLSSRGRLDILEKIESNLGQCSQLIKLETRLRMHLERLETMCINGEGSEKEQQNSRILRIRKQIDDHSVLRKAFDRRDTQLDKIIFSVLNDERSTQWRFYKETWKKLMAEKQEIDERLQLGRDQVSALQKAQPGI